MFMLRALSGFAPSGMTKNGSGSTTTSFADITGWIVDPAYPGSAIDSNTSLIAQGAKSGATLTANIPFSGSFFSGTGTQVRILVNGVVVATGTAVATSSGTATCVATGQNINQGDLVKAQIVANGYTASPTVTAGTSTYLRIT